MRINTGATDAQLEWSKLGALVTKKKPGREDLEVFETAYNAACGSIARGELAQGEVLLKRAKDLCNALDELTEKEKNAELFPISVQQLYVLNKLGKTMEAEALASSIVIDAYGIHWIRCLTCANRDLGYQTTQRGKSLKTISWLRHPRLIIHTLLTGSFMVQNHCRKPKGCSSYKKRKCN